MGHGGYQLRSGLALLIDAGFLSLEQRLERRPVSLQPRGLLANQGRATDEVSLNGLRAGVSAEYHRGDELTFTGRLGLGLFLGWAKDARSGTASTNERTDANGNHYAAESYSFDVSESPAARYLYVAPEARLGWRLAERFELSVGMRALVLVGLTQPTWRDENPVLPDDRLRVGLLTFGADTLAGRTLLVVSPGLGARFDF
jgi:hypothetical protein